MQKGVYILVIILLSTLTLASPLYQHDSLKMQLDVNGEFELIPKSSSATLKEAKTQILIYPKNNYRQAIVNWESQGEIEDEEVQFVWDDGEFGVKEFGYSSTISTNDGRMKVNKKIEFPISQNLIQDQLEYLHPTETIDSNNQEIIAKAEELVQGEDDLFKATFKMAEWVERNVEYDLNSLTEKASQKASWVLENKQGVCDEMTSLFVAMARSQGIPARFASGISYTTSELFNENWQPHGWAEVYFPDVGWVGFDITFGEYGYVDVTHIKFRDGFDPKEPATEFQWIADKVDIETKPLDFTVTILEKGEIKR